MTVPQSYWDRAIKVPRWQHPAIRRGRDLLCAALNVNLRNENVEVGVELTNTLVEIVHSYVQPVNSVAKFDLISSQNITNVSHSSLAVARKCVRCDVHKISILSHQQLLHAPTTTTAC